MTKEKSKEKSWGWGWGKIRAGILQANNYAKSCRVRNPEKMSFTGLIFFSHKRAFIVTGVGFLTDHFFYSSVRLSNNSSSFGTQNAFQEILKLIEGVHAIT